MNDTEPVTRTRVTWMLVIEPRPGELTIRGRGPWEHVQAQLREDRADPQLAGKRLGLIRTDLIEIEHPVQWQEEPRTGPGAELTPADMDALVTAAAELWDHGHQEDARAYLDEHQIQLLNRVANEADARYGQS